MHTIFLQARVIKSIIDEVKTLKSEMSECKQFLFLLVNHQLADICKITYLLKGLNINGTHNFSLSTLYYFFEGLMDANSYAIWVTINATPYFKNCYSHKSFGPSKDTCDGKDEN